MIDELDRRYLGLAETRERYARKRAADAALVAEAVARADADAMRATERLSRVVRAFQDGKLDPDDYAEQRAGLLGEREAADAALARARKRSEAVADEDVTDEVLDRLREVRAAVLGGLDRAADLDGLRSLLRQIFESVIYSRADAPTDLPVEPSSGDWEAPEVALQAGTYLLPILRSGVVVGYVADPRNVPAEDRGRPGPHPIIARTPLDLDVCRDDDGSAASVYGARRLFYVLDQ